MSIEQKGKDIDNIINISKWQMYGEKWEGAERNLEHAKDLAIDSRDKARIDIILDLLKKAKERTKVPVS